MGRKRRGLITGKTVTDEPKRVLEICTNNPLKWRFVDLETGQVWRVATKEERLKNLMLGDYLLDCQLKTWPPKEPKVELPIGCRARYEKVKEISGELYDTFINGNRKDMLAGLEELEPKAAFATLAHMMIRAPTVEERTRIKKFLMEMA